MLAFRRRSVVLAAVVLAGCSHPPSLVATSSSTERIAAIVTRNTDGDTFWLSGIGKVRIIGVDTPEVFGSSECFGRAASAFVKRLLPPGTHVTYRLGVDPRDRYGRALAYVWLADGRMVNALLAERGYATPMTIPPNVEYADRFVAAARRAREAGRGLWRACGGS
ncbi:MAG: thermonuclease family protein [Thermoleophilaceae bacterium]